jgi:predicted component of type VI protein secretion system
VIINIAGVKVQYTSFSELEGAIKAELAKIETRLKRVAEEHNRLRRAHRGLKQVLEGKKPRAKQPVASASAT